MRRKIVIVRSVRGNQLAAVRRRFVERKARSAKAGALDVLHPCNAAGARLISAANLYTYLNFCNLFVFLRFTRNLLLKFSYSLAKRNFVSRVYLLMGGVYVFF